MLSAPVWGQQTALGETEADYAAFTSWLATSDLVAVAKHTHARAADLVVLAQRMQWDVRAREYWTASRAEGAAAIKDEQAPARESRALAREVLNKSLSLVLLEVEKALVVANLAQGSPPPDGPPRLFDNRELIQSIRAIGGLDVMRERAGLASVTGPSTDEIKLDWDRVPADELEAYRRAREKALGR